MKLMLKVFQKANIDQIKLFKEKLNHVFPYINKGNNNVISKLIFFLSILVDYGTNKPFKIN